MIVQGKFYDVKTNKEKNRFNISISFGASSSWCIVGEPYKQKARQLWRREPRISPGAAPGEPIAGVVPPQYDEQGGTAIVRMKIVCMQVVLWIFCDLYNKVISLFITTVK